MARGHRGARGHGTCETEAPSARTLSIVRALSHGDLVDQLAALGVRAGGVLEVHASFRALRPVEGGPLGFVAALREALWPGGTLVMPTMTDGASVFDPASSPSVDMGITAELFRRLPGVVRSDHPGGSFAAEGPLAAAICAPQPLEPPHGPESPPGRVVTAGGQILLAGVGYDACTPLHVAEAVAGVPYGLEHPCVVVVDGAPRTLRIREPDHCCRGFERVAPGLRAIGAERRGPLGHGEGRLVEGRALLDEAARLLAADPLAFLCSAATCEECDAARASVSPSGALRAPARER